MPATLKREELDRLAAFYSLSAADTGKMLDLAGARPSRAAGLGFVARCLRHGGILSLACALVFFVAANWSRIAIFGRFALLEILLAGFVAVAFVAPPPRFAGRGALFLAFICAGALLALFGQTYQTGADIYELFLTWSLLGLPLVIAAQWSAASAAWVVVLNVALLLYCGWQPQGGVLWSLFSHRYFGLTHALFAAAYANLALWALFHRFRTAAVPDWVQRILIFCSMAFITWVGLRISMRGTLYSTYDPHGSKFLELVGIVVALVIPMALALRERRDIFPLAMVMMSVIILVMSFFPRVFLGLEEGMFFVMALWLIGTSTLGGRMLLITQREWREEDL